MGFLDNLLKNGTRKIISNVVDSVADNIKSSIRGSDSDSSEPVGPAFPGRQCENDTGDDEDCCYDKDIVCQRIEMIAAEDWPSYELRRNIPAADLGADEKAHGFDYGLYLDGQPKVMIMILNQHQYRNQNVIRAHSACKEKGVGSFHLLLHLPNRKTYIAERIKAVMPS